MPQVHVRLDLEHESGERRFDRQHSPRAAVARLRRRRPFGERVQNLPHPEVVDGRAKEHGRLLAGQKLPKVERMTRIAQQVDIVAHGFDFVWK